MRFPLLSELDLPCVFLRSIPGRPHPDGRRYLPTVVLRLSPPPGAITPPGLALALVDRHHRVREADVGRAGRARLVFALSAIALQQGPGQLGLRPEPGWAPGELCRDPDLFGQVLEVAAWEEQRGQLAYESLYTELLLDIGGARVGLRTSRTATSLAAALGKAPLEPGDWVRLWQSRIDILGFEPAG